MRIRTTISGPLLAALTVPAAVAHSATPQATMAESNLARSSVSVAVEPALSDGRVVIKVAAQNRGTAPTPFGPSTISLAKPSGEAIALYPLSRLIEDVRLAAGMATEAPGGTPTPSAYAAPQLNVREGRVDVTGYTGGSAVARDEIIRRTKRARTGKKPSLSVEEANRQIAALHGAVLQDRSLQPKQVAAGQVVSEPLTFKKGEDRTLHLRVRIADDEHGFTIAAPKN